MSHKHHRNVRWTTRTVYFYSAQKQLRSPLYGLVRSAVLTVTVCDRQTPIALLVPIAGAAAGLEVREPTDANALPMALRITLKEGIDVVELLRVDRDDR